MADTTLSLNIDVDTLTVGDIEDLEEARKVGQIIAWLVAHAGAEAASVRALPVKDLRAAMESVRAQMAGAFSIPKQNGDVS